MVGTRYCVPLADLGIHAAIAYAINEPSQTVGTVPSLGTGGLAALRQNGTITNLGTLPEDFAALATRINNHGQ